MKYIETAQIALTDIDTSNRLRDVDEGTAIAYAESIKKIGQQTPIEVVPGNNGHPYKLVAGMHRYRAHEILGLSEIRAEIKKPVTKNADLEARLHEITENLLGPKLTPLERAVFLGERQEIYEAMYPEAKKGAHGGRGSKKNENEIVSFSKNSAEVLDISERTVQIATAIYKGIPANLRRRIHGTPLADKQGELYKLTQYAPDDRKKIVDACLAKKDPAPSVVVAAQRLHGQPVKEKSPADAFKDAMVAKWRAPNVEGKAAFLDYLVTLGVIPEYDRGQL